MHIRGKIMEVIRGKIMEASKKVQEKRLTRREKMLLIYAQFCIFISQFFTFQAITTQKKNIVPSK